MIIEQKSNRRYRGVRLGVLHALTVASAALLSVLLLIAIYNTKTQYDAAQNIVQRYMTCQQSVADVQTELDFMSSEAQTFIITGEKSHVSNYFQTADLLRDRNRRLNDLVSEMNDPQLNEYLEELETVSNTLMTRECYAMRLIMDAYDYTQGDFPDALLLTAVTASHQALPVEDKVELARSLVFNDTYQGYKDNARNTVFDCLDSLSKNASSNQIESTGRILSLLRQQMLLVGAFLLTIVLITVLTACLMVHPLRRSIAYIEKQEEIPVAGSREMRILVESYNRMLRDNKQKQDQLSYDASHDPLTGLNNRGVFERLCREFQENGRKDVAMVLIDVDNFKEINDNYGHDVGDKVLKRVAILLQSFFRADDSLCRIGGDEMAVILYGVTPAKTEMLKTKLSKITDRLKTFEEGLPVVTLSVGIAFSDSVGDLFKEADNALYQVKQHGRSGVGFYTVLSSSNETVSNSG